VERRKGIEEISRGTYFEYKLHDELHPRER